ncbi:MAG: tripartite tricarboxylate transporter substrate binding protein [Polaromonas sp.]|nr:tripartite tricarboxylate transporter substrate binding protein [Polaromonas sp.]
MLTVTHAFVNTGQRLPLNTTATLQRTFWCAVLAGQLLLAGLSSALAQSSGGDRDKWPSRPIRMIIPFTAGGPIDVVGRQLGQKMAEALNTTIVYDNRAGANGIIGIDAVAKAAPDGYTMLITTGSFAGNSVLYKKLPHDPLKDFAPITQIYRTYGNVLVVNPDVPAKSLKELITLAQAKPEKLSFSSAGYGNLNHLNGELFNSLAQTKILHVPYKGAGPAFNEVVAKQIDMTFASTAGSAAGIKDGRVRALAISGTQRAPILPDVPTYAEQGLKGMEQVYGWGGLWYPAGTPQDKIDRIQQVVQQAMQQPDLKAQLDRLGLITVGSSPADFAKFVMDDMAFQATLFKLANIQPQ